MKENFITFSKLAVKIDLQTTTDSKMQYEIFPYSLQDSNKPERPCKLCPEIHRKWTKSQTPAPSCPLGCSYGLQGLSQVPKLFPRLPNWRGPQSSNVSQFHMFNSQIAKVFGTHISKILKTSKYINPPKYVLNEFGDLFLDYLQCPGVSKNKWYWFWGPGTRP